MAKNIGTLVNSTTAYEARARASRLIESWSEETATQYQAITGRVLSEVKVLHGREQTVNANANLSPTGKFDAVKDAVQAWFAGLTWLRNIKDTLERRLGNNFGELFVLPKSDRGETAQALRDHEIRSAVRALPPPHRDLEYLRAAEADDAEVLRAIQQAPMPLISAEVRLRGDDVRAARLDPARYRKFIETGELLGELHAIARDCEDLAKELSINVTALALTADELGPAVQKTVDFAVEHQGSRGKQAPRAAQLDVV